jgi:DNA topoisomerase-1
MTTRLLRQLDRIQRDPLLTAKAAGLRYVTDAKPGLTRHRAGKSFSYRTPEGTVCRDKATLTRIKSMALPPAWTNVWICADANGHLQATGVDALGRKQYRYHPDWNVLRNQTKYHRLSRFAEALPGLRRQVAGDLRSRGIRYEKVLALVVSIMERTSIRVGSKSYSQLYGSYGLTTLQDEHVDISGSEIQFKFVGKKGIEHDITLRDRRLAALVKQCRDIPGDELFQYYGEDGSTHCIGSGDVNGYLKSVTGDDFTAKDFRTWKGTVTAFEAFCELGPFETEAEKKRNVLAAYDRVAAQLGNTRAVCRKYYVHPAVVAAYESGTFETFCLSEGQKNNGDSPEFELSPLEVAVKSVLDTAKIH